MLPGAALLSSPRAPLPGASLPRAPPAVAGTPWLPCPLLPLCSALSPCCLLCVTLLPCCLRRSVLRLHPLQGLPRAGRALCLPLRGAAGRSFWGGAALQGVCR